MCAVPGWKVVQVHRLVVTSICLALKLIAMGIINSRNACLIAQYDFDFAIQYSLLLSETGVA